MSNMQSDPQRLVLGAAQLGMDYGVANITGKPDSIEAEKVVRSAWEGGVREFDTAPGYGDSQKKLGRIFETLGIKSQARVISKIDTSLDHLDKDALGSSIKRTLEDLRCDSLYGLMLHRESFLELWDKGLGNILETFIDLGMIEFVGVSVYSNDKALQALSTEGISMVQVPANIFDRRFEDAGVFQLADELGKTVYIRSVFLQGLLLMNTDDLPKTMMFAEPALRDLCRLSEETGLSRQELALGYVKSVYPDAKILFGAETELQVKENMKVWEKKFPEGLDKNFRARFAHLDERILNPSLW